MTYTKKTDSLNFTSVRFAGIARSDDDTRYFMKSLHVEDIDDPREREVYGSRVLIGTDGRRLHIAPAPGSDAGDLELEPGEYRVLQFTAGVITLERIDPVDFQFPNWRRVVNGHFLENDAVRRWKEVNLGTKLREYGRLSPAYARIHADAETCCINLSYFQDLAGFTFSDNYEIGRHGDNGKRGYTFQAVGAGGTYFAIIASMMIE